MTELVSSVHVNDGHGMPHVYGPGDEVPEWAAKLMGAHCFEGGVHPYPSQPAAGRVGKTPAKTPAPV